MLALITTIIVLIAAYIWRFYENVKKYPKGPTPLPLIGNLHLMNSNKLQDDMQRFSKIYGSVFTLWLPRPFIIIMDYKALKEAFVTKGDDFIGRSGIFPDNLFQNVENGGVIFSQGDVWKDQRRTSIHILRDFGMGKNLMEEQVQTSMIDFMEHMENHKNLSQCDFRWPIQILVANVINQTLFGFHYKYDDCDKLMNFANDLTHQIECIRESPLTLIASHFTFLHKLPYFKYHTHDRFMENVKGMKQMIREETEKALIGYDPNDEPTCFVQAYYQKMQKSDTLSSEQLINVAMDFFLAGMETTSTTLRWGMLFMAAYQNVQDKVRKEIHSVIGTDRLPAMSDKANMPYTSAMIQELQRMANILPLNVIHRTVRDTSIQGIPIPNDTLVLGQIHNILSSSEVFEKSDVFNPERFLMSDGVTPNKVTVEQLVPFSMGKRQCAGEGLARMELFLGMAGILQKYKIEPQPNRKVDLEPTYGSILLPKQQELRVTRVYIII